MNSELKRNCQYCSKCETYYLDVIEETCRCPAPLTEEDEKVELRDKWLVGDVTL